MKPIPQEMRRNFTPTEIEILGYIAMGWDNDEIAAKRGCSPNTVRTHIQNMLVRAHVHSRAHLIALAYESGVFVPEYLRKP
jgi:DNA-binding NarL/FixJ family response regulator